MINEIIYGVSSWISDVGFLGIFLAAFVETMFPPIPSEVIFPLAGFIAQSNGLGLEGAIGMGGSRGSRFYFWSNINLLYCIKNWKARNSSRRKVYVV